MELRQLRYFIAVAETLHFGRAAQRLHLAQPALSRQVSALERELGAVLLSRNTHGVALTEAGTAFLVEARKAVDQVEVAVKVAKAAAAAKTGHLEIGSPETHGLTTRLLRAFNARYPDVKTRLHVMTSGPLVQRLREHTLDVGVVYLPVNGAEIQYELIHEEPYLLALPAASPLAGLAEVPLKALSGLPLLMFEREANPAAYDYIMDTCTEAGLRAEVLHQTRLFGEAHYLIAAGYGWAFQPPWIREAEAPGVVIRPVACGEGPIHRLAVAWHSDAVEHPLVRGFVEIALQSREHLTADWIADRVPAQSAP